MHYIANILSKIGDCILASLNQELIFSVNDETSIILNNLVGYRENQEESDDKYVDLIFSCLKYCKEMDNEEMIADRFLNINYVLVFYHLAAIFHLKGGRTYSFAFQYKKVLFLLRDILRIQLSKTMERKNGGFSEQFSFEELLFLIEQIVLQIIKANAWTTDISNRPQILKYRNVLNIDKHSDKDRWAIYNNTTNASELREVILLAETIKLTIQRKKHLFKLSERDFKVATNVDNPRIECSLLSPYSNINSQYLRILELKYRNDMYYFLFADENRMNLGWIFQRRLDIEASESLQLDKDEEKRMKFEQDTIEYLDAINNLKIQDSWIRPYEGKQQPQLAHLSGKAFIAFVIREALFCNQMIIQIQRLFGENYISSYNHLASAHERTGNWCVALENLEYLLKLNDDSTFLEYNQKQLQRLIGSDAIYYLEPNYHFEIAIQNYYYCIQTHSEGRAYRNRILNFYFLEDDYHDNLSHFSASMERLRINTGNIRDKIRALGRKRNNSRLYKLDEYYPGE